MLSISLRVIWCKAAALHSVPNLITKGNKCGINLTAARLTVNKIISTQTSVTRQALCIFFSLPHFTFIFNNLCTLPGCLQTQCRKCPPCYFLQELSILQEKLVVIMFLHSVTFIILHTNVFVRYIFSIQVSKIRMSILFKSKDFLSMKYLVVTSNGTRLCESLVT